MKSCPGIGVKAAEWLISQNPVPFGYGLQVDVDRAPGDLSAQRVDEISKRGRRKGCDRSRRQTNGRLCDQRGFAIVWPNSLTTSSGRCLPRVRRWASTDLPGAAIVATRWWSLQHHTSADPGLSRASQQAVTRVTGGYL